MEQLVNSGCVGRGSLWSSLTLDRCWGLFGTLCLLGDLGKLGFARMMAVCSGIDLGDSRLGKGTWALSLVSPGQSGKGQVGREVLVPSEYWNSHWNS